MDVLSKEELLKKATDPKVLPFVAKKVLTMVRNEDSSISELGSIIEKDQAISANVLKIANSAFYGVRQEVKSLRQAIVVLGFKALKDLVITVSTKLQYKQFGITEQMMWDHSIGAAVASRMIAEGRGKELEDIAFLGGLMHDFGKVIMNNESPRAYMTAMEEIYNENSLSTAAEYAVFGYDHTEIGSLVVAKWGFASVFIKILQFHHLGQHTPEDFPGPFVGRAVACVHLADNICRRLGIGFRSPDEEMDLEALPSAAFLGLSGDKLENLVLKIQEAYQSERAAFQ